MAYGAIDIGNAPWYTDLTEIFLRLGNELKNYNWLITDSEVNSRNGICERLDTHFAKTPYVFLSGEELTELLLADRAQWIWGVLSGFPKELPLEEILKFSLPCSEHPGFWKSPVSLQHPLAEIEIAAFDSMAVLVIGKDRKVVDRFRDAYPNSLDLEDYNHGGNRYENKTVPFS